MSFPCLSNTTRAVHPQFEHQLKFGMQQRRFFRYARQIWDVCLATLHSHVSGSGLNEDISVPAIETA